MSTEHRLSTCHSLHIIERTLISFVVGTFLNVSGKIRAIYSFSSFPNPYCCILGRYASTLVPNSFCSSLVSEILLIPTGLTSLTFDLALFGFLADRTATQYDRLLTSSCFHLSVRLSVRNAVHCGSQGRCTGRKVVPACS